MFTRYDVELNKLSPWNVSKQNAGLNLQKQEQRRGCIALSYFSNDSGGIIGSIPAGTYNNRGTSWSRDSVSLGTFGEQQLCVFYVFKADVELTLGRPDIWERDQSRIRQTQYWCRPQSWLNSDSTSHSMLQNHALSHISIYTHSKRKAAILAYFMDVVPIYLQWIEVQAPMYHICQPYL